jgi:enoyl-CoA hydratase
MRQKQVLFRQAGPREIFNEIGLPPGRNGLIWGADGYALDFARSALERGARIAVIASAAREAPGIAELRRLGVPQAGIIDRDRFDLPEDMPDPLTADGQPNPAYNREYMASARAMGKVLWGFFGPRVSPDFIVERIDQSTLHFSTFLLRDFNEADDMPCGFVVARGPADLSIHGSHMYRASQARDVVRLLASGRLAMEQEDLEVTGLDGLADIQQKMLDGRMAKPKGVALVQAKRPGLRIADLEDGYLGECLVPAAPEKNRFVSFHLAGEIGILSLCRESALNALSGDLVSGMAALIAEIKSKRRVRGRKVGAVILRGSGRAFAAGADVTEFRGSDARRIEAIALQNLRLFADIEGLKIPVIALVDGFALGGGNELAMSAHYRIVTENAAIGQPEVKLGIIPGYGGMQRLPRLVGPAKAVEMSINGEPIDGREALRLGLADEFAPSAAALRQAYDTARAFMAGRKKPPHRDWDAIAGRQKKKLAALLKRPEIQSILACEPPAGKRAEDLAAARTYAGRIALEAVAFGYAAGFKKGLKNDARLFGEVAASLSGQAWIGRFLDKDPAQSSFLTLLPEG